MFRILFINFWEWLNFAPEEECPVHLKRRAIQIILFIVVLFHNFTYEQLTDKNGQNL